MDIDQLIREQGGIQLDLACGANKQKNFVGMDYQALPGVDIVWDLATLPWPLPSDCAIRVMASHYVEHVPKVIYYMGADGKFHSYLPLIEFMNEVWRILKPGGQFAIAVPHGYSLGYQQDPTHASALCEATWVYFTPDHPFYQFYKPRPWKISFINWDPSTNIEVVMEKLPEVRNG